MFKEQVKQLLPFLFNNRLSVYVDWHGSLLLFHPVFTDCAAHTHVPSLPTGLYVPIFVKTCDHSTIACSTLVQSEWTATLHDWTQRGCNELPDSFCGLMCEQGEVNTSHKAALCHMLTLHI